MTDSLFIEDAAIMSIDEMGRVARDAKDVMEAVDRNLTIARAQFQRAALVYHDPSTEAGRSAIEAELPALVDAEHQAVEALERRLALIDEAHSALGATGWRPHLTVTEILAVNSLVPNLRADLESRPIEGLVQDMRTAVAHRDVIRMAAWGQLGHIVEESDRFSFIEKGKLADAMRECRKRVRDGGMASTEATLLESRNALREMRADIVRRANDHIPGTIGNALERHVWTPPTPESRYDRDLLRARRGG